MDNHIISLQWRYNGRDGVSNYQPRDYLLNRLSMYKSKEASKLRVTGLCAGNSPVTGEFHAQMDSNAENVSIWWRHHVENCVMFLLIHIPTLVQLMARRRPGDKPLSEPMMIS